jgi:hypothetical protein
MKLVGFILGLISLIGWAVALIPLLGWLNWIFVPLAVLGLIFSVIGVLIPIPPRRLGIAGIIMCLIVVVLGIIRLKIGCGII